MTFRSAILDKRVRISSWMPSAKYALALSSLRFSNGSTAMLFSAIGSPTSAAFPEEECATAGEPRRYKTEKLIAKATAETSKIAVSTYLGQPGVMTGRTLTPDVCFHLLLRLSLSGRCGL